MYGLSDIDKLKEAMEEVEKYQEIVKNKIFIDILSVKNPKINKISNTMFTISSADLVNFSLSPEYYNIGEQSRRIVEQLELCSDIKSIKKKIEKYLGSKKIICSNYSVILNDIVLEKLKEILNYLKDI